MKMDDDVPAVMKAVMYDRYDHQGDGIRFVNDSPTPETGGALVVLKVSAAALNPVDYKLWKIPVIGLTVDGKAMGLDVSGVVVYAPKGSGFQEGDEVFGFAKTGSFSEFCATKPEFLAKKPATMSHIEAAMLPTAGVTSLQALRDIAKAQEGDKVLIIGASGGCGSLGVQVAKALGCKVTAVCSTKNVEFVKSFGADVVHAYDSEAGPMPKVENEDRFDCIYDTVSAPAEPEKTNYEPVARPLLRKCDSNMPRDLKRVAPTPKLALYVATNAGVRDWVRGLVSLPFLNFQRRSFKLVITDWKREALEWLGSAYEEGKIRVSADEVALSNRLELTKEHVDIGLERLKSKRTKGKVVFGISDTAWAEYLDKHKSS